MEEPVEMTMPEERSLADQAANVEMRDETPTQTPESFDLQGFMAGIRPTRRSVQLFPQGDLIAEMDRVVEQIDKAPRGTDVDALIDRFDELKRRFHDGVWFTVEKRSTEWVENFRRELEQTTYEQDLKSDDEDRLRRVQAMITLHQLVEQIIDPVGVTFEQLLTLESANEGELNKLAACLVVVNSELAQSAQVLTRDFSARRSATIRKS